MRAAVALIRFELEQQGLVVAVALAIGLMTLLLPLVPGGPSSIPPTELLTVATGITVVAWVVLLALALGASLFAKDAAEHRATFLFSRPISAFAMAAAKLVAATLLLATSAVLIVGPSLLAGAELELALPHHRTVNGAAVFLEFAILALVALLFIAAIALMARARTTWVLLELVAVVACGLLIRQALGHLAIFRLTTLSQSLWAVVILSGVTVLGTAFLASFLVGRVDLARAHRAQAIVVGSLLPLVGASTLAWTSWLVNPSASQILTHAAWVEPLGRDRFAATGYVPGHEFLAASVLLDGGGEGAKRISRFADRGPAAPGILHRSQDRFFWAESDRGQLRLFGCTIAEAYCPSSPTGVVFDRFPSRWAVSSDGTRFAGIEDIGMLGESRRVVIDLESGGVLASSRVPDAYSWNQNLAPESDGFRLIAVTPGGQLESWRLERDGAAQRTAARQLDNVYPSWALDAEHGRVFEKTSTRDAWTVYDSRTLTPLFTARPPLLEDPKTTLAFQLGLFADGSVAVSARAGERREIARYSAQGDLLGTATWTGPQRARVVAIGRASVLIAVQPGAPGDGQPEWNLHGNLDEAHAAGWIVRRIDLEGGPERELARDLYPYRSSFVARPGPALLRDDDGAYYSLDPDSGELKKLNTAG